ncbi:hypothetical protein RN001_002113 [Aquatica leii]|uniref:Uncharacterized protein n=1 Tax=Aquatica leii TaxID=1421715 RepID=A0AAN7SJY2_9COLE|nr:hypothetical protein RN001_002113 [Aquatica leii]
MSLDKFGRLYDRHSRHYYNHYYHQHKHQFTNQDYVNQLAKEINEVRISVDNDIKTIINLIPTAIKAKIDNEFVEMNEKNLKFINERFKMIANVMLNLHKRIYAVESSISATAHIFKILIIKYMEEPHRYNLEEKLDYINKLTDTMIAVHLENKNLNVELERFIDLTSFSSSSKTSSSSSNILLMSLDKFGRSNGNTRHVVFQQGPRGVGFKVTIDNDYDMENKRLLNVGDPIEPHNALNLKYYMDEKCNFKGKRLLNIDELHKQYGCCD